jgi:hypothetical protein
VVHIEKNGLCAFEQHASAVAPRLIQRAPGGAAIGQNARRNFFQFRQKRCSADFLGTRSAPERIVMGKQPIELCGQRRKIGEVDDAQRPPADLVFVRRPDAAHGRADALQTVRAFARMIEIAVQR